MYNIDIRLQVQLSPSSQATRRVSRRRIFDEQINQTAHPVSSAIRSLPAFHHHRGKSLHFINRLKAKWWYNNHHHNNKELPPRSSLNFIDNDIIGLVRSMFVTNATITLFLLLIIICIAFLASSCFLSSVRIRSKSNIFFTREPYRILNVPLSNKSWEYHSSKIYLKPRIFYIDGPWTTTTKEKVRKYQNQESYSETNISFASISRLQQNSDDYNECQPKAIWQTKSFPNCNIIHEIEIGASLSKKRIIDHNHHYSTNTTSSQQLSEAYMNILGEGWFRTTWRLERYIPSVMNNKQRNGGKKQQKETLVFKTLRNEREFLDEYYELHRRDAVAMERLTSSKHIVNIYGYCGNSVINEIAIQNLKDYTMRLRGLQSYQMSIIQIRLSISIAIGICDIHAAGTKYRIPDYKQQQQNDSSIYMVHYDLNPSNIALFANGSPKINDFNVAEFLQYNPRTNESCGFTSRFHDPSWRAPEEMNMNNSTSEDNNIVMIDDKVDIYSLGSILFQILTTHAPWYKIKEDQYDIILSKVSNGIHPPIPNQYINDNNPHIQAIIKAIQMCWIKNPKERASAIEVATVLCNSIIVNKTLALRQEEVVESKDINNICNEFLVKIDAGWGGVKQIMIP